MTAIRMDTVMAQSNDTLMLEGRHYFPAAARGNAPGGGALQNRASPRIIRLHDFQEVSLSSGSVPVLHSGMSAFIVRKS